MKKAGAGFRLQLVIGATIVLIMPAIAISSVLRSYQAAQESSAIAQIRAINEAEKRYHSASGGRFGTIMQLISARDLDSRFAYDSAYNFAVVVSPSGYTVQATPRSPGSARYGYYSEADGIVRYQTAVTSTCDPCFPGRSAGTPIL